MLTCLLTFLLISNAVTLRRDKSINFSRIAIKSLLFSSFLAFDNLLVLPLDKGIDIYGGLLNVTALTQAFILILLISAILLTLYGGHASMLQLKSVVFNTTINREFILLISEIRVTLYGWHASMFQLKSVVFNTTINREFIICNLIRCFFMIFFLYILSHTILSLLNLLLCSNAILILFSSGILPLYLYTVSRVIVTTNSYINDRKPSNLKRIIEFINGNRVKSLISFLAIIFISSMIRVAMLITFNVYITVDNLPSYIFFLISLWPVITYLCLIINGMIFKCCESYSPIIVNDYINYDRFRLLILFILIGFFCKWTYIHYISSYIPWELIFSVSYCSSSDDVTRSWAGKQVVISPVNSTLDRDTMPMPKVHEATAQARQMEKTKTSIFDRVPGEESATQIGNRLLLNDLSTPTSVKYDEVYHTTRQNSKKLNEALNSLESNQKAQLKYHEATDQEKQEKGWTEAYYTSTQSKFLLQLQLVHKYHVDTKSCNDTRYELARMLNHTNRIVETATQAKLTISKEKLASYDIEVD